MPTLELADLPADVQVAQTFDLESVHLFVRPLNERETTVRVIEGNYVTVANLTPVRGYGSIPSQIAHLHLQPMDEEYCRLNNLPCVPDMFAFRVMRDNAGFDQDLRLMRCRLSGLYELRSARAYVEHLEQDEIARSIGNEVLTCWDCRQYFYERDLRPHETQPDECCNYGEDECEYECMCLDTNYYCQGCMPELWQPRRNTHYTPPRVRFFRAENQQPEQTFVKGQMIDSTPYMGFELEMELNGASYDNVARTVTNVWGDHVTYGTDGSLDCGIEFKTEPHTLEAYQTFDWSVLNTLINYGCRSYNTRNAGVHVNISRASFTNLAHEYKFGHFILKNRRLVERVAQRRENNWCRYDGENNSRLVSKLKTKQPFGDKYQAVNWGNRDRVEVRVFKGTLKPERLMSYLEFVHSVHAYTKQLTIKAIREHGFAWSQYETWLTNQPNATYQNIKHYLFERGN